MIRLHPEQLNGKLQFMHDYISAQNAADGSKMDANANVTQKNIATMEAEIMKDFFVQINRAQMSRKIAEIFDQSVADEYIRDLCARRNQPQALLCVGYAVSLPARRVKQTRRRI